MADVQINVEGTMSPNPEDLKTNPSLFQSGQALSLKAWLIQFRQNIRPWTTFFNTSYFKSPPSLQKLSQRIIRNIVYFQSNYFIISLVLTLYCLLTTPLLLLAVCCSLTACYMLNKRNTDQKLKVFGHELTVPQQYALVAGCSLPIYIWVGAGSAMFWVLGASIFFSTLHAAFFNISAVQPQGEEQFDSILEQI